MTIELSAEEQQAMEKAVAKGQFTSVDQAVHAAVRNLSDEYVEWLVYARDRYNLGLLMLGLDGWSTETSCFVSFAN